MHFSETREPHLGQEALIKIALLDITCDSDDLSKPRCRETKVRNTLRKQIVSQLLGKTKEGGKPMAGESINFWEMMSNHKFAYAVGALGKKDRTYRAHLRCISNAVLRTPFKEGIIGWDQRGKVNGESNGLRLKTLESCHKWAVHIKEFTWIPFYVFLW